MIRAVLVGTSALVFAGCASVSDTSPRLSVAAVEETWDSAVPAGKEHYQFAPLPPAETIAQDLEPAAPRSAAEILSEADSEFQAVKEAQALGDDAGAYDHYAQMMDRLIEAKLDAGTFARLREQYSSELNNAETLARIYDSARPDLFTGPALDGQVEGTAEINARVQAEIEAIQRAYPKSFQAGLDRSYKYLPYVRAKFAEAGLPEDLVWLAMVESQFTPKIDSRASASGMWQFMKGTGRRYGLRSDWYLDERYDWRKSTGAAVQYLSDLYEMFDGNWPLAVTAYNMGEGGLERAIKKAGGEDDLWQLLEAKSASGRIKLESKRFYAKLLATAIVAKNPEQYGFEARPQPGEEAEPVKVNGFYSLAEIEKQSGLERGTLAKLNPQFIRGYTPPQRDAILAVPTPHNGRVMTALASMPELHPGTHVVQRGETLSQIAAVYRVPVGELQTANRISSPKNLRVGQQLIIPGGVAVEADDRVVTASASGAPTYTVRRGDSLSRIADKQGVSVKDLQRWNGLGSSTTIRAGQRLTVAPAQEKPTVEPSVTASAPAVSKTVTASAATKQPVGEMVYHTVKKGEYPAQIAKAHGVRVDDLLAWNGLTKRSTIQIGQKLKIGVGTKTQSAAPAQKLATAAPVVDVAKPSHVVRRGETVTSIAKKHGVSTRDLLTWNGLSSKSILHIGDTLVIQQPERKVAATSANTDMQVARTIPSGTVRHVHVVAAGERAAVIADLYDVPMETLYEWNGWTRTPVLGAGDEVVVFQPIRSQD
jgi:membrane-bound lytic murein transglycosylase D